MCPIILIPDEPSPLSPAHLMTLKDSPNLPSADHFSESDLLEFGKKKWRRLMYLSEQFWLRWRKHYVLTLQERKRCKKPNRDINEDDLER